MTTFNPKAAAETALEILKQNGPMTAEQLTYALKDLGHIPNDDRSFGGVYFGLSKRGQIIRIGEAKRKRGHLTSGGNIWGAV